MAVRNKTKKFDYFVYDKDLGKDINKYCAKHYSGSEKVGIDRKIPFQVVLAMEAANPDAIQKDMLLKKKVRAITDPVYTGLLKDLSDDFKEAGKKEVMGTLPLKVLDDLWEDMQKKAERAGNDIGLKAHGAVKKYLDARNDGKVASFSLKYRRYKAGLAVAGSTVGATIATATAVGATAATLGATSVAAGFAIAGASAAVVAAYREYKRQTKTVEAVVDSIHETIDELRSSISVQQKKEVGVTSRELLAKMTSSWFSTNIRSIKKLEQDIKKLKELAQLEVLKASKNAAQAHPFHEQTKVLKRVLKGVRGDVDLIAKGYGKDIESSFAELKRKADKLEKAIDILKKDRDAVIAAAAARRTAARKVIKNAIPKFEDTAAAFKERRHAIGWTGVVIGAIPAAVQTASYGIAYNGAQASSQTSNADAAADLAVALGEELQEFSKRVIGKAKKLK